jgi:hypothetical protein
MHMGTMTAGTSGPEKTEGMIPVLDVVFLVPYLCLEVVPVPLVGINMLPTERRGAVETARRGTTLVQVEPFCCAGPPLEGKGDVDAIRRADFHASAVFFGVGRRK